MFARARRHWLFLLVLLAGLALRILAQFSFHPALLRDESDSFLAVLDTWRVSTTHPDGYGLLLLTPLSWFTEALAPIVAVQHLLGLGTGVLVYLLLLRWGVWRWLAAVATVPVLLDAHQVVSEHLIRPDTLFVTLLTAAVAVLCWRSRPGAPAALLAGVLLGLATTTRVAGLPLVVVAMAFLLLAGVTGRARAVGVLLVAVGFAVPVLPYAAWYASEHGDVTLAATADDGAAGEPDGRRFSSYLSADPSPSEQRVYAGHGGDQLEPRQPGADALASYQDVGYVPGPLLVGGLVLGAAGALGVGRARSSRMRAVCFVATATPAIGLLGAAAMTDAGWPDQTAALVLWPAAAALGLTALLRGRRGAAAARPQADDVDHAALVHFRERYGVPSLAPVVVVIAAYNEEVGLPRVLASLPTTVCGLPTDVVVVDDGSSDGTADVVRAHPRAYLVECPVNRGQGAAMRLGYRVARDHRARYIITTDADAQYDAADLPVVLAPLLDGTADFVTGSRRLGHQHTQDRFRRAGVYVFAWTVGALTGERLTDTSFGLRAMRAVVTGEVTLNQPQYQSSELLIGVHSHGFRIAEVPATMHVRAAGSTKKGRNLVYGARYARVVLGTWWREACPAPVTERAPALLAAPDRRSMEGRGR